MSASTTTIVDTAQTYGWDTVFAVHIADVNAAITKAGTSPAGFSVNDEADHYSVVGEFGTWQIVPGGSGDIVCVSIPFRNAVVTSPSGPGNPASGTAVVKVRLDFLHKAGAAAGHQKTLELRVSATVGTVGEDPTTPPTIVYSGTPLDFMPDSALKTLLHLWLNANLGEFDHVFATVDINRAAAHGGFQWLQPTDAAYAYSDLGTESDGILAVMCMTEGRSSAGLVQQVSPAAVPPGQRAGFLISKERLFNKILLPIMPHLFSGSRATDYALSKSGASIVNATQDVSFTVTGDDGKSHDARIVNLSLDIVGSAVTFSVTTRTEVSPGIQAFCRAENFLGIHLVRNKNGEQTLSFFDVRDAIVNHWPQNDSGFSIAQWVLIAIAAIALLVAAFATAGTALAVGAVVIGILAGLASGTMFLTTTLIDQIRGDDAPVIGALLLDSTAPINWTGGQTLALTSAGLNDSLQLCGTLTAAAPGS